MAPRSVCSPRARGPVALALFFVGITLLGGGPARAQLVPAGEPPTPGVYNPTLGIASDADASAVEKNPALLGFLRSWSGVYLHSELSSSGVVGGRGDGFFFASPLPYLRFLMVGAGVQLLRPPSRFPYPNQAKLSLSLAWRIRPNLSFGLTYAHVDSDKGPVAGGLDTLDLALAFRLGRFLAAGLVVHDLTSPTVAGLPLQRVWEPEVALRPFRRQRLELAVGARFGERRGDIDPHARLWVTPRPGLTLKADLEVRRDVDLDGIAENDVRVALGLQLDLERVGVAGFGLFGSDQGLTRGHGFTLAARVSGERYPAVWTGPKRLEKLDLRKDLSGRKLAAVLARLRRIEHESRVAGVVVVLGEPPGRWASAEELRAALLRLRRRGKHVYAYLIETSTRGYYVASAAERVYQDPAGGIRLIGLHSTATFFKGTGELLGVRADFVKIAEYKAAPETYTRTDSSAPARAQRDALLDDVYRNLVEGIASTRKVQPERVRAWIDGGPYTAAEARRVGLVDELGTGEAVERAIAERLGRRVAIVDPPSASERPLEWQTPQIAVLFVEGDLVGGKSRRIPLLDLQFTGAETLVGALVRAREDPRVKAIVLRVDSPGGSALASDLIARELERTKAVKPLICSLGDTAASGGYFIAAPCQRIFIAPSTLTGSIGIFTGKFDVSGLASKLGVTVESYERGARSALESMWRGYTEEERKLILDKLRYYYSRFVDTVARGRGLDAKVVDGLARGRIWSGAAAQARGLADAFGGLMDAVAEAKRRAGYSDEEPMELLSLPTEPGLLATLAGLFGLQLSAKEAAPALLPGLGAVLRALPGSLLVAPTEPQARLDAHLEID